MSEENSVIETGKQVLKKKARGGNSPVIGDNGVNTKPGDNSKIAGTLLQILQWGEVDRSNIQALESRFWQFIEFCMNNDIRITNQMTYLALGINKDIAYDWEHGHSRTIEHCNFIKR